jgi:hypothetical protein
MYKHACMVLVYTCSPFQKEDKKEQRSFSFFLCFFLSFCFVFARRERTKLTTHKKKRAIESDSALCWCECVIQDGGFF